MAKTIVVALGGNALIKKDQKGTVYEQFANSREALSEVVELINEGHNVVLTHGNGPQVGNIIIRTEAALGKAYDIPLGVAVAESEGEIGYMLQQTLQNKLRQAGIKKNAVTVLTQVVCDKNDPQLKNPTKPIGPFYSKKEISKLKKRGIKIIEDSGRGYRRVVPSPIPRDVVEKEIVKLLLEKGVAVIAAGGGGMPVYLDENGNYEGIDAVVDKDLASAVLGNSIGAQELIILTSVEFIYEKFNTPQQKPLRKLSVKKAKKLMERGEFADGSMKPKVKAAIQFLENGGERVIITSLGKMLQARKRKTGTEITL